MVLLLGKRYQSHVSLTVQQWLPAIHDTYTSAYLWHVNPMLKSFSYNCHLILMTLTHSHLELHQNLTSATFILLKITSEQSKSSQNIWRRVVVWLLINISPACFQENAFVSNIFPNLSDLFWLVWVLTLNTLNCLTGACPSNWVVFLQQIMLHCCCAVRGL